ncbi:hypothetical protein JTB14_023273 [Gonioctena quinquepunctata]|nr:hypothetical protein JTB14_023273 [Gonioctena quinquepunctata]
MCGKKLNALYFIDAIDGDAEAAAMGLHIDGNSVWNKNNCDDKCISLSEVHAELNKDKFVQRNQILNNTAPVDFNQEDQHGEFFMLTEVNEKELPSYRYWLSTKADIWDSYISILIPRTRFDELSGDLYMNDNVFQLKCGHQI